MTNVSSIAIELKSSRGTFNSIVIELKLTDNAPLLNIPMNVFLQRVGEAVLSPGGSLQIIIFFLIYLFIPTQVQNRQIILHIYININLLRLKHNNKLPRRHYFNTEHTYDPYLYLVVYVTLR